MLWDPTRHEPLRPLAWDDARVRATIAHVVADAERRFEPGRGWPLHPRDVAGDEAPDEPVTPLYDGACGVVWALSHLEAVGAVQLSRCYLDALEPLRDRHQGWLAAIRPTENASFLNGDTPFTMLAYGREPTAARADELAALIEGNADHPSRELMWGAPGTLLAALFLHERSADPRWAALFRAGVAKLWSQLEWSTTCDCAYWTQDLYGHRTTYLDAVHGFVATALPLIRGRHLLGAETWAAWERCIVNTIERTATREGAWANWRTFLDVPADRSPHLLMQFCHGAPGFVVCLAELPSRDIDPLLLAAGEAIWAAGPLTKGSNLCHGTGGNGYAFLKLFRRSGDARWLDRARAFAMHGIAQMEADAAQFGQLRHSLWTGDPGFGIYLWSCLHGGAAFPTLDVFYA